MRIDKRVGFAQALVAALEPLDVGVAVIDPRTLRFTFVSDALASVLGASGEDLLALPSVLGRVVPDDAAEAEACFRDLRAREITLRLLHASGRSIQLDVSVRPFDLERAEGRALAIVARNAHDGGERESLRGAAQDAIKTLQARDEFFSIASHELRTPLTPLRIHAQALTRALDRDPPDLVRARRSGAEVERHADRMTTLTEELLDVARIRSGRLEIACVPCDLAAIVREVAARFGAEAATRGATIIIDGESSVPGHWDPLRIEQVVTNLVSNGLKYGEGNPIALELRASSVRARLMVRDSGSGIAEAEQERIFEPFERAARDPHVRGAGLGLWIVRRLVEAHGGNVTVASVLGKGTVFVVELPRDAR